jgi:hypothetical protein
MKIMMSPQEIELLTRFMASAEHYFEFGMGGSTCLAANTVGKSVCAIDSDPQWVEKVRQEIGETGKSVVLTHIDIGPTGGWGTPHNRDPKPKFDAYSQAIIEHAEVDFCLVDGRFRVASFLQAVQSLRPDSIIAIHDYSGRPQYRVIEEFARRICACHELFFFVRRPGIDESALSDTIERYRRNYE